MPITKSTILAFIPEEDRSPLGAGSQEGDPPTMDLAVQQLLDQRSLMAETKEQKDTIDKELPKLEKDARDDHPKGMIEKEPDGDDDDDDDGDDDDDVSGILVGGRSSVVM
jgi:hypothetical protein